MACMSHASLATAAEPLSNDDVGMLHRRIGELTGLLAELEADQSLAQAQQRMPPMVPESAQRAARRGGGRRPAPGHLPIERIALDPPGEETAGLVRIREEITEELDYRPSRFIRRHYVRGVYVHARANDKPHLRARLAPEARLSSREPAVLARRSALVRSDSQ